DRRGLGPRSDLRRRQRQSGWAPGGLRLPGASGATPDARGLGRARLRTSSPPSRAGSPGPARLGSAPALPALAPLTLPLRSHSSECKPDQIRRFWSVLHSLDAAGGRTHWAPQVAAGGHARSAPQVASLTGRCRSPRSLGAALYRGQFRRPRPVRAPWTSAYTAEDTRTKPALSQYMAV